MRSAESIVREYLDAGFSLESLRVLAESRPEPLCSEILAILGDLDGQEAQEVACEPAVPVENVGYGDMVFFVASDDETVDGDLGVDFDVMAETARSRSDDIPASLEESVAEICIGETEGSDIVSIDADEADMAMDDGESEPAVWSRRWSRPRSEEKPAEGMAEAVSPEAESEPSGEPAAIDAVIPETPASAPDTAAASASDEERLSDGSVEDTAMAADENGDSAGEDAMLRPPVLLSPLAEKAPAGKKRAQAGEKAESRKDRRRRERAEKKKKGRKAKNAVVELPEIVLTLSEGTDTMMPEMDDTGTAVAAETSSAGEAVPAGTAAETTALRLLDGESSLPAVAADAGSPVDADETGDEAAPVLRLATADDAGDDLAEEGEANDFHPAAGEHLMIIANGGLDLRDDAYRLLSDDFTEYTDYEPEGKQGQQSNVILFREHFAELAGADGEDEEERAIESGPVLRMLPPVAGEETDQVDGEAEPASDTVATAGEAASDASSSSAVLSPVAQLGLLRALCGAPEAFLEESESASTEDGEHVIVAVDEEVDVLQTEADARAELEQEYQERLDAFATRVLEAQALTAESEARVRDGNARLSAKEAELNEMRLRLAMGEERLAAKDGELAASRGETEAARAELENFSTLHDEHKRLYAEFEDLRLSYNEVVTEVMPELQNERDDLSLTVERQCAEGDRLRSSLGQARRRLAVGYSMGAAACLLLIALPVLNWMKAGGDDRELAMGHQEATELRERMERAERRNVESEQAIFELQRQIDLAQLELNKAQEKNVELARIAETQYNELRGGGRSRVAADGTPTRASTVAMQSMPSSSVTPPLRSNQVRDPGGRIRQTALNNQREREAERSDALASRDTRRIPVSAVARPGNNGASRLRPPSDSSGPAADRRNIEVAQRTTGTREPAGRGNGPTAKVKAGEGVAQVVYRVLGTRDPEIIDWVIRENGIKSDRRGNPRIYPDQELRLPQGGRTAQTASR